MIIIIVVMIHHIFLKENEHQMARTNKLVQPLSRGVWGMQDKSIIIIIIILMSTETEQKYYYGELNHISN